MVGGVATAQTRHADAGPARGRHRIGLSTPEWVVLAALVLYSTVPLLAILARGDGVFTGADGPFVIDQLQYLAWVRDAGENGLISNRFDTVDDPPVFLNPMFLLSGGVYQLTGSVALGWLLWKPVSIAILFGGFAAYVRRFPEPEPWLPWAALALALWYFTPATPLFNWIDLASEEFAEGTELAGYVTFSAGFGWTYQTALAVGCMPLFLLGLERLVEPGRRRPGRSGAWYSACTATAGLTAAWAHPWQGLVLLVLVAGLVAWARFDRRQLIALAVPVAATAAPLAYYFALSKTDTAWNTSDTAQLPHLTWWVVLALLPIALPAAFGVGARAGARLDVQERALHLWPLASVAAFLAMQTSYIYHLLSGISLPLAILAVRGVRRLRVPAPAAIAGAVLLTLPGAAYAAEQLAADIREARLAHTTSRDDSRALDYIERSPRRGGVLGPVSIAQTVPALTGRRTWVGHPTWTPAFRSREAAAERLFAGQLGARDAQAFVRSTGAAFLLSDCRHRGDLAPRLGRLLESTRRFGCATVYEIGRRELERAR